MKSDSLNNLFLFTQYLFLVHPHKTQAAQAASAFQCRGNNPTHSTWSICLVAGKATAVMERIKGRSREEVGFRDAFDSTNSIIKPEKLLYIQRLLIFLLDFKCRDCPEWRNGIDLRQILFAITQSHKNYYSITFNTPISTLLFWLGFSHMRYVENLRKYLVFSMTPLANIHT